MCFNEFCWGARFHKGFVSEINTSDTNRLVCKIVKPTPPRGATYLKRRGHRGGGDGIQ